MKLGNPELDLDEIDIRILKLLQSNCKQPLAKIGDKVGLSAPAVVDRVKKLEDSGVVVAYRGILDARQLGKDVTAFIGVSVGHPRRIAEFEAMVAGFDDVLECHHVTGHHTLLLKVKTANTSTLEELISKIRSIEGVERTETMVVLSTHTERTQIALPSLPDLGTRRVRRNGDRQAGQLKGV
jgi:Lrp/AsnC family leucine-responsive transcriptional regulator